MSYSLNIVGHLEGEDAAEREQKIVDAAREFVQSIEGVNTATMNGQHTGGTDLKADADANA